MGYTDLKPFRFWCQKVLPLVYDDSLSYYEVLAKMVKYLNDMLDNQDALKEDLQAAQIDITELKACCSTVKTELEKVKNGEYVSLYLDSLISYIDNNLKELVARIVKYVIFGLSDDGHFVAYIPDSWDFIKFDTIINPQSELYGHLIMQW